MTNSDSVFEKSQVILFDSTEVSTATSGDFFGEFEKLDDTLTLIEKYNGIIFMPSYLGIRQSYRLLASAIQLAASGSKCDASNDIVKATQELFRARQDATGAIINYCHYKLLMIDDTYSSEEIFKLCPEYFDVKDEMNEVNVLINSQFENLDVAKTTYNDLSRDYLPKMLNVYSKMVRAENVALSDIKEKSEREEKYKKMAIVGTVVGIAGFLLGIAALFV